MKKRVLSLALAVFMLLSLMPMSAMAGGATSGAYTDVNGIVYTLESGVLTVSGDGPCGSYWQDDLDEALVTEVVIESGITSIGYHALYGCSSLTSITIPDSVTEVGYEAFSDCTALESITIPNSVTSIDSHAFYGCSSLTSVSIPDSVTSICEYSFAYCSSLTSITIPGSVTEVAYGAFYGCSSLTSITIPDSVTSIGQNAFYDTAFYSDESNWESKALYIDNCLIEVKNTAYGDFIVKDGTRLIADGAFYDCSLRTSISIPDSVTCIGDDAFTGCTLLTSIVIPDSVTEIKWGTFADCSSLTSITIPDSITSIGDSAFSDCTALESITIPDSVTSIGYYVFSGCTALESITIPDSVTYIGGGAFSDCSSLTSVIIPSGVTSIDADTFCNCSSLASVVIPSSVISIGEDAFKGCSSLTSVSIPGSVTSIGYWAFYGCSSLESVTIPNGVTNIDWGAFDGCSSLTSITIPDSVTSIGGCAFSGCSALASVSIPSGVTSIGERAFEDCSALRSVNIPDGVTSIGYGMFEHCTSLTSVNIPDSVTSIEYYAFFGCSSLESITIPSSVTIINDCAFKDCSLITSFSIPNGVTSIGDGVFENTAFYNNESNWENAVLYIDNCLIEARAALSGDYKIKDSTKLIADGAFYGCTSLTNVTIPKGVTSIGNGMFFGCTALTNITIPEGVTSIEYYAFFGCNSLASVTIYDSLKYIGEAAFYNCEELADVYFLGTQEQWNGISIESDNYRLTNATIHYSKESHTHAYTDVVTAPTCTAQGYTTHSCACGESYVDTYVDALGHDYKDGTCTVCGAADPDATIDSSESYTDPYGITYTLENGTLTVSGEGECSSAWMEQLDASTVTKIVVKDGITSIGDYAFAYCKSLTSVTVPDSVTNIGMAAFWDSSALVDITIGSGVTRIGADILMGTAYLDNEENWENGALYVDGCLIRASQALSGDYSIKEGTHAIADSAFSFGNTVTSIVIPDGVTRIGEGVFNGCGELASITIPVSVTSISDKAFSFCTKLADIYYGGSEAQWNAITIERTSGDDEIAWDQFFTAATKHFAVEEQTDAFTDVVGSAYYAKPVAWAVANNITGGYNDGTFRPMNVCTRAQIVTFIWRANGSPEPLGTAKGFTDVAEGTYYYKAVLWAAEKGITGGFDDGGFHPDELVTRAQAMTFLWRAEGKPAVPAGTVNTFKDVPEGAYYHDAVLWAVANGVTGGYDTTTFGSMDGCTRAQIVTFLYRDMAE